MNQLDVLLDPGNRNTLFLAEAAGWLHDYRKCSEEHIYEFSNVANKSNVANPPGPPLLNTVLVTRFQQLAWIKLDFLGLLASQVWTDLLDKATRKKDLYGRYLQRCHNTSHFDKQDPIGGKQNYLATKVSNPFGFEQDVPRGLTDQLWKLPWDLLADYSSNQAENRDSLRAKVRELFAKVGADTRRPINEVDLWSWGSMAGALYKSALAGLLLSGVQTAADDLQWRLLSVNHNGLDFLVNVARVPDMLARQQLAEDGLDKVNHLLEFTYPLATEVYRDERGSIFVVPNLPDLLDRTTHGSKDLRLLISKAFAEATLKNDPKLKLAGEMTVHLQLEDKPWWGQDPKHFSKPPSLSDDQPPQIITLLTERLISLPNVDEIDDYWLKQKAASSSLRLNDICSVCGLRPQGPARKAAERRVCNICEERRGERSEKWMLSEPSTTIWTDEVADINGRLALLTGQFDLDGWLDGSLLSTLFVIATQDLENTASKPVTSKNPSFSRLHRIWETTRRFWQEVREHSVKDHLTHCLRLQIDLAGVPELGRFHVYDLELGATDLSVVWAPPEHGGGYLISADNLGYIARRLDAKPTVYNDPAKAAAFMQDYLQKRFIEAGCQPVLRNPEERARNGKVNLLANIRISQVQQEQSPYFPAISLLAEPRTFMMLMPANNALKAAHHIKEKYENEMGKVRDRLPIHLGLVFAERRTPVRALLEAGRAMLDRQSRQESWEIKSVKTKPGPSGCHFSQAVALDLARDDRQMAWRIPIKMGDGTTDDLWYPYLLLNTDGDDAKANPAGRRAEAVDWLGGKRWVVHAADLMAGETVTIRPSTFDFEFLDSAARRFEVFYDSNGRRPRPTRPFYLEDLDRLEEMWLRMKDLQGTQRHQVVRTIESTREAWHGKDQDGRASHDAVFRQFVADTLAGASWPKGGSWKQEVQQCEDLVQAGVTGELADLAELHMEILKEK